MERHLEDLIAGRAVPKSRLSPGHGCAGGDGRDGRAAPGDHGRRGSSSSPRRVIRKLLDIKIFIDADSDLRFIRRLGRDLSEKEVPFEEVCSSFLEKVKPMHLRFVMPSKRYADIIVPMGGQNDAALEMVVSRILSYLG